ADPAVVGRVDGDAGRDDLVDAVEDVVGELDVGGGELRLEVLHGAGADDRRGDGGVAQHERDGQVDQAEAGLLGDLGEGVGGVELALVVGQRHVEPVGGPGRGRGAGVLVLAVAAGEPAAGKGAVGEYAHAVPLGQGQDLVLDVAGEDGVGGLLGDEPFAAAVAGDVLGVD